MTEIERNDIAKAAPILSQTLRKVSLRLLPFLFLLYIVSYLDRINLSFAALKMNADLGFSDSEYGFGAGIFFLGYCLFGIPSNHIVEKFGPRRWIALIMVLWGFITIALCLVRDPFTFALVRFILGAAEAGFFPGMLLYLTYWFPKREYGTAVARFMTAIPAAGLLGSLVAEKALGMEGLHGLAGWKWLFLITGAPAVVLGAVVPFMIPDRPEHAKFLSPQEKAALQEALSHEAPSQKAHLQESRPQEPERQEKRQDKTQSQTKAGSALTSKVVWTYALIYFTLTVSMYGFQFWLPQVIKAFSAAGQSDAVTSRLTAIPAIFQGLGMLIIAASSDKKRERSFHLVVANALTAIGLLSALYPDNGIKFGALSLAAFGIWGAVGPFWALCRESLPRHLQATGIALINSVGNLGGFAGPFLIGFIKEASKENGLETALATLASASLVSALIVYLRRRAPSM
ncbi:MAG: MFS transporter [Candidatus Obscuribacter phosphatis]|uniref:MFS transporter n=1 Tax=Candidatus Obscuribacter phosphatis TaxID=1906157 RepID=A0A8J7TNG7_9BACT|nr:MFS transporter [Candidatus Obscuribacter phosphatis]